jgi:hypothetical protein
MNDIMLNDINKFYKEVGNYIKLEYEEFHKIYTKKNNKLFDLVGRYYLGGNNTPDTAGMIVDYLKIK